MPEPLRTEVPAAWARMVAAKPHVWDGRILGFSEPTVGADGVLRAMAQEDDYSAFIAWREAGFPPIGIFHLFGSAIIRSVDGAFILGVMGGNTVNAGRVYFPGGSLEPRDAGDDGMVDVEGCIATEMLEETGLLVAGARQGPLFAIADGAKVSIARVFDFPQPTEDLLATIRHNLSQQAEQELADVVACRVSDDGRRAGDLAEYAAAFIDAAAKGGIVLA
jgi:8-oxo-dGTP pyrophosphatase MutT (NUDIX family)